MGSAPGARLACLLVRAPTSAIARRSRTRCTVVTAAPSAPRAEATVDISVMPPGAAANRAVRKSIWTTPAVRSAAKTPATSISAARSAAGAKERGWRQRAHAGSQRTLVILSPTYSPMATCSIWFTTGGDATVGKFRIASPPPTPTMVPTRTPAGNRKRRPSKAPAMPEAAIRSASTVGLVLRLRRAVFYSVPSRSEPRNVSITFGITYGRTRIARANSKITKERGRVKKTV